MVTNLEKSNELQENSFNQELKGLEREVKANHSEDDRKWVERPSVPMEMRSVLDKYEVKSSLTDAEFKTYMGYINKYKTHAYLSNLTKITDYQATEIVKNSSSIDLRNLTSITDKQAEILSKAIYLVLNGLKRITDKQAELLGEDPRRIKYIELNGLTSITDKQAESLSKDTATLELNGLSRITDKQAETFSKLKGLDLYGLTSITDKQAKSLSNVGHLGIMKYAVTPKQKEILLKEQDKFINIEGGGGYTRRGNVRR